MVAAKKISSTGIRLIQKVKRRSDCLPTTFTYDFDISFSGVKEDRFGSDTTHVYLKKVKLS